MINFALILAFAFGFVAGYCACKIGYENKFTKTLKELEKENRNKT